MQILDLSALPLEAITHFESASASALQLASTHSEARVHWLRFEAGGRIGLHRAGFDQLFLPVLGAGWVETDTQPRQPVAVGQAAVFRTGEVHAKGTDGGLQALMIQLTDADLALLDLQ